MQNGWKEGFYQRFMDDWVNIQSRRHDLRKTIKIGYVFMTMVMLLVFTTGCDKGMDGELFFVGKHGSPLRFGEWSWRHDYVGYKCNIKYLEGLRVWEFPVDYEIVTIDSKIRDVGKVDTYDLDKMILTKGLHEVKIKYRWDCSECVWHERILKGVVARDNDVIRIACKMEDVVRESRRKISGRFILGLYSEGNETHGGWWIDSVQIK